MDGTKVRYGSYAYAVISVKSLMAEESLDKASSPLGDYDI